MLLPLIYSSRHVKHCGRSAAAGMASAGLGSPSMLAPLQHRCWRAGARGSCLVPCPAGEASGVLLPRIYSSRHVQRCGRSAAAGMASAGQGSPIQRHPSLRAGCPPAHVDGACCRALLVLCQELFSASYTALGVYNTVVGVQLQAWPQQGWAAPACWPPYSAGARGSCLVPCPAGEASGVLLPRIYSSRHVQRCGRSAAAGMAPAGLGSPIQRHPSLHRRRHLRRLRPVPAGVTSRTPLSVSHFTAHWKQVDRW